MVWWLCVLLANGATEDRPSHDVRTYPLIHRPDGGRRIAVREDLAFGEVGGRELALDLYLPKKRKAGELLPVVVFVNGIGDPPDGDVKDWAIYRTWLETVASHGFAAVMGEADPGAVPDSIRQLLAFVRSHPELGLDGGRIGAFACSANVTFAFPAFMEAGSGVSAAVLYYGTGQAPAWRTDLPVLSVLAGLDGPGLIQGQRAMWGRANELGLPWTMVHAPTLPHAFDALDPSPESAAVIDQTLAFWTSHLAPAPVGPESGPAREAREALAAVYGQRWEAAATSYGAIVARDPEDGGAWQGLAWAQQNLGQLDVAERSLLEAQKRASGDPRIVRSLAIVRAKQRRCAEARETLGGAEPDPFLAHELGICALAEGDVGAAVPALERAAATGNPMFRYNLACALARKGDADAALTVLEALAANGFGPAPSWRDDPDLASLSAEPRFLALVGAG